MKTTLTETQTPKPAVALDGPVRQRCIAYTAEIARAACNHCRVVEVAIGEAMIPAEAINHLDSARMALDRLIHKGSQRSVDSGQLTVSGISAGAMRSVQQLRAVLNELSRNIEQWRVAMPGQEFPETVLLALDQEGERVNLLMARAAEL